MQRFFKYRFWGLIVILTICFSTLLTSTLFFINSNTKFSKASFKCPEGFTYFEGKPENKNIPLPHNCTKSDTMVMACENDYIPDPVETCKRDLVVYKCPATKKPTDFVIYKSISNQQVSSLEPQFNKLLASFASPIRADALLFSDPTTFLPDKFKNFGDLCTDIKNKDNFSVGNICNNKIFGENPTSLNKPINLSSNGTPLPDENGLVSYFNDLALKFDSKDYGKFKADLYDIFNNDSSPYSNQLCQAPAKALRANITTHSYNPGCAFGIGCTATKYYIDEVVADVADTCNLQTRTCISKIRCIRSIHKCEPQNLTFPIEDFIYYIGKEQKDENGVEMSNGRAVQFEPDYENLPQDRSYLPNTSTTTICPNSSEWRPFFIAAKTDFQMYDTSLLKSTAITTPYTCVKKGFDLKAAYTLLRDASQDCGERTTIFADNASNDDSALLICIPPLTSTIKVPVCPGGSSIKVIGNYTNIEGDKCFESIAPEEYIVDENVIGEPVCTPKTIKPKTKLNCVFNLNKANFAGYNNTIDFAKIVSDPNFKLPTDNKFESCKPLAPLPSDANKEVIKTREDEIYYNKITCIALTTKISNQKYSGRFVLDKEVKVKINNIDGTNLATSDNCKIPSTTIDNKTVYENLLVCENINIGESFVEESKNVILQIGNQNYTKGKIDAKLRGCAEGISDIYDCYQCLSGQAYSPGKPCFQLGKSEAKSEQPIKATKGNLIPTIPTKDATLPNNTPATLQPEGCTEKISGTIQVGGFVPNPNQIIPKCSKTGSTNAIIEAGGNSISIPTNFSDDDSPNLGASKAIKNNLQIGDPAPTIDLPNNTLPNGTPATFTPNGAAISIKGVIKDNQFVPDQGQIIPVGSTPDLAIGILKTADSSTGILINIQSNPELIKNVPFVRTGGAARN